MEIFKFINSKDIRKHLENLDYQFTSAEAAFLVYQCQTITLEEKISAWEEIILTMPDCEYRIPRDNMQREKYRYIPSIHKRLSEYIEHIRQAISNFSDNEGYIYRIEDEGFPFLSLEDCFGYLKKEYTNATEEDCAIRIYKQKIYSPSVDSDDTYKKYNSMLLNHKGIILDVSDKDDFFDEMWFSFPTPFKHGDIVYTSYDSPFWGFPRSEPFVLYFMQTWNLQEMLENGFSKDEASNSDKRRQACLRSGDISDMGAYGYNIRKDFGIWNEFGGQAFYLNLEYYREPLTGRCRALKPISEYLKKTIDIALLVNSYSLILLEEYQRSLYKDYFTQYMKESLELAGLSKIEELNK